ncbi:hypothetical protein ACH4Q6_25230 [Streptomyces lydicus]
MTAVIELDGVGKCYPGGVHALREVSFGQLRPDRVQLRLGVDPDAER